MTPLRQPTTPRTIGRAKSPAHLGSCDAGAAPRDSGSTEGGVREGGLRV